MDKQNRSYRIKTDVVPGQNTKLNVKLDQNFDTFDILSLKINQENFYKFHMANYGVVIGRVVGNGGIGIPNAKISVFIKRTDETKEDVIKNILYPYDSPATKNLDGIKYNLLLNQQLDDCYRVVGTFPPKRRILDNDAVLEVYDEYYKYSTVSNNAGDYMLFGLPLDENAIHIDLDLSDCGFLSQKPRDMFYRGYNIEQFDSPVQFKKDTNLDNLAQIFRQDGAAFVYPFWGDQEEGDIAITRYDIDISYKFESTCIFLGSAITDGENAILHKTCQAQKQLGEMSNLTSKQGKIQMIRKTFDGIIERFQIKGDALIDGDGVWAYQIPMNLDYVVTDEYGNIVPTDNPNKGIATRAEVRFRFILEQSEGTMRRRANYLVPMNPNMDLDTNPGVYNMDEVDYEFGESTMDESFATLFWNKVYSVKSYIPRTQIDQGYKSRKFVGIKNISNFGTNNPFPFNTLFIDFTFVFSLLCIIAKMVIRIVEMLNSLAKSLVCMSCWWGIKLFGKKIGFDPCKLIAKLFCAMYKLMGGYISLGDGWCPYYEVIAIPGGCACTDGRNNCLMDILQEKYPGENLMCNAEELLDCVISALAEQYEIVKYDFGNDWINGVMYFPTYYYREVRKVRRKWLGLFGPKKVSFKREFCGIINEDERAASHKTWFRRGVSTNALYYNCSVAYQTEDNESYDYSMDFEANKKPSSVIEDLSPQDIGELVFSGGTSIIKNIFDKKTCKKDQCYKQKSRVQFANGLVNLHTDKYDEDWFYYRPYDKKKKFRLYTTDIILLGSLNDCDIDGVFQLHTYLPLTSYNMPSILKDIYVAEDEDENTTGKRPEGGGGETTASDKDEDMATEFSGPIIATGANWGKGAGRNNTTDQILGQNNYSYTRRSSGLFLGIDCIESATTNKSCVNVQRVCEVGVELNITREKYFTCDDLIKRGKIEGEDPLPIAADGYISKDELIDGLEIRQMFATLNHHRLINDNIIEYKGHKTYKFEYHYPTNFDGKLANNDTFNYPKVTYNGKMHDSRGCIGCPNQREKGNPDPDFKDRINYKDEWFDKYYHQFRFGHSRIDPEHDYYDTEWLRGARPVNSFYFYFGVKPGKTAIEQFRQKFWGTCVRDTGNDLTAQVTIINHASVCTCNDDDAPKVKFLVEIRNFSGSYDLVMTDEWGNAIELEIGQKAQELEIDEPVDLTLVELLFSEEDDSDVHFYNEIFKKGGKYNLTVTDASGQQFTTVINILIQNIIDFNSAMAEEITAGLSDSECDGKKCPKDDCTNDCDCVCCNDYLKKPEDDNVNALKARVQLKGFDKIIKKGCTLCDYELVISRYRTIGLALTFKVTGNKTNGVTALEIKKYDDGGSGWEVTPPPGTPELTYTTSSGLTKHNPMDFIQIPGGNGGLMRITKVDTNGTVSMSPLGLEIVEPGTDYNNYDSVTVNQARALLNRKIYDLGSEAFWFNCEQKSCSDFEKDMDRDFGIDLYMCSGEYEITIRNKDKEEGCIFDSHTETISVTEHEPLCLTMDSGTIKACKVEERGEDREEKDCWWYWFYLWLINDNYKYEIDETKPPANGLPDNVPSPCPADPNNNDNWKNAPEEQGIMFWYSDNLMVNTDELSVRQWKDKLRATFIAQCDDNMGITLGGTGFAPPYVTLLFGANYPAKGGPDPSDQDWCEDCNPGTGADANDSASKFKSILIDASNPNNEMLGELDCSKIITLGCQYNIPYKTSKTSFSGNVTKLKSICETVNPGEQLVPDGVALTISRIPKEHPCGVWKNYEAGGYYAGVMGLAGFGTGWPGGLGGIMKKIRSENGQTACEPVDPSMVIKFEQVWDKLESMGFPTAANDNLFYFHIIDKRLKILKDYARVAAFKADYAQPEKKDQDVTECHVRNINGFFDIYYQNGPNIDLRQDKEGTDYEFVVSGVDDFGIDQDYHLSTTDKTLPGVRHIYSTDNSKIEAEEYTITLEHYQIEYNADGTVSGSTLICTEEVDYPFGTALNYGYITVEPKVQCPIGEADVNNPHPPVKVANSYCYNLIVDGTPYANIGLGCFDFFKIRYKSEEPAFGWGAKISFFSSFMNGHSVQGWNLVNRGGAYQKDQVIYAYPSEPGGSPASFRITDVDPNTGAITGITMMSPGAGFKCPNPTGGFLQMCVFTSISLYPPPVPIEDNIPENILYFPYPDYWGGDMGHFNRPLFTYDVINDLHLDEPGPAPNQDLDIETCSPIAEWNSKYIKPDLLEAENDPKWNVQSTLTEIAPWVRVGNEWQEYIDPITGQNYNKFMCGGLPADGSAMITDETDEIYFTIVHDKFTNVRAFSQPLDFGNYLRVCMIECDPEPFDNLKNYQGDDTFGGSTANTTNEVTKAAGACMLNMYLEVVGRNAYRCYGYTWTIQQGNYEYREDKPKANELGWENYYCKDNNVLFVNDKYENSQNCWIKFIPTSDPYIYDSVKMRAKEGLDPQIYSNENNGVLEAPLIEMDVKDRDKIVRISMVDVTGTEFYMYTSVFRWIDTCPYVTYCIYDCNERDFSLDNNDWGIVVDFEIFDSTGSWLFRDVTNNYYAPNNGAGYNQSTNQTNNLPDFPRYGTISKSPTGGTPILQQGKNWIKVNQPLSDGTILEKDYRGKLFFGYGGVFVELDEVVVSNCNFIYKAQINLG